MKHRPWKRTGYQLTAHLAVVLVLLILFIVAGFFFFLPE